MDSRSEGQDYVYPIQPPNALGTICRRVTDGVLRMPNVPAMVNLTLGETFCIFELLL